MSKLEWIVEENHASDENFFICEPYSYKAGKHVLTDIDNHTTTFSKT